MEPFLRRRYALLEGADLVGEGRLVAYRARYAPEEGRHLAARLHEAEDVVDEEEDVLAEGVAEMLGHRKAGEARRACAPRAARSSGRRPGRCS